jgi:4-hydroxybenzoate polyprenyltransferase
VYALARAVGGPGVAVLSLAFVLWVGLALWFLRRRQPGDVPRAVVSLIAGISLLDAVLVASAGNLPVAWLAVAGFALTLALQRFVAGT